MKTDDQDFHPFNFLMKLFGFHFFTYIYSYNTVLLLLKRKWVLTVSSYSPSIVSDNFYDRICGKWCDCLPCIADTILRTWNNKIDKMTMVQNWRPPEQEVNRANRALDLEKWMNFLYALWHWKSENTTHSISYTKFCDTHFGGMILGMFYKL